MEAFLFYQFLIMYYSLLQVVSKPKVFMELHSITKCNKLFVVKELSATVIGVTLDPAMDSQFKMIKSHLGIKANTEVIRSLIREKYREIIQKTPHLKVDTLTEEQLIEAANDYAKAYRHLDPEGVTEFLKERYYWLPKVEIERGVQFICSLKIKN